MVEDFDPVESELREHLRPREAPPGFAGRVAARVADQTRRRRWLTLPSWRWSAAVAALLVAILLGGLQHARRQRLAGQHARAQVLLALRITGATLRDVQQKINDSGSRLPAGENLPDNTEIQ